MHIEPSTHEQSHSAKVYTYEADFDVSGDTIHWHAQVRQGEEPQREIHGEIPITSPALPAYAEKAVRDAIVQGIDHLVSVSAEPAPAREQAQKGTAATKPNQPDQPRVDDDPPMQGEGSYAAARRFDKAQQQFVKSGKVAQAAQAAKPKEPREADALARAEQAGRDRAKR